MRPASTNLSARASAPGGQYCDRRGQSTPASVGAGLHFKDLIDQITVQEQVDEITGMSQLVVVDSPDEKRQSMIQVKGPDGSRKYLMPTHAHVMVKDGDTVHHVAILRLKERPSTDRWCAEGEIE